MALKPTIYKLRINLSDLNRDHYDTLNLTIAQHPSENLERMMARVMALCINAQTDITFTKGLSEIEEPDIWVRTLDQQTALWIDVGEPAFDRLKKASRHSQRVCVYSFNSKSDVWWQQGQGKFRQLPVEFFRFPHQQISDLAALVQRTMDWSVTITEQSAYVATASGEVDLTWEALV